MLCIDQASTISTKLMLSRKLMIKSSMIDRMKTRPKKMKRMVLCALDTEVDTSSKRRKMMKMIWEE